MRRKGSIMGVQKWTAATVSLQKELSSVQRRVHDAICDDFDTPTAMAALLDLVKATHVYLSSPEQNNVNAMLISTVAQYVTSILKAFGLIRDSKVGWDTEDGSGGGNREEILAPVLDALMDFRASVRDKARNSSESPEDRVKQVLKECDTFRDDVLPALGIRLEDLTDGPVWKLANPEELLRERQQKELEQERKRQEKEAKAKELAEKEALNRMPPSEYMKQLTLEDGKTPKYTQFDDDTNLPTHASNGEPLNKNQTKKAQKEYAAQQKKYDKYLKQQQQ